MKCTVWPLASFLVLSAGIGMGPAMATGFYQSRVYDVPMLVDDRLVLVRVTPQLRRQIVMPQRARFSSYRCHRRRGPAHLDY